MNNITINRILVALDAMENTQSLLQAASTLAHQLDAKLQAIFVKDLNLVRMAELPFTREMKYGSPTPQQLSTTDIEQQLELQAMRLRNMVEATAHQLRAEIDFNVYRGEIDTEVCAAAQQSDLLVLGKTTHQIISTVSCDVLLLNRGTVIERPIAVLFDGTDKSLRALQLAIALAHQDHEQLCILYPACDIQILTQLQQQTDRMFEKTSILPLTQQLMENTATGVQQAILSCHGKLLVIPGSQEHTISLPDEELAKLIKQEPTALILIQ